MSDTQQQDPMKVIENIHSGVAQNKEQVASLQKSQEEQAAIIAELTKSQKEYIEFQKSEKVAELEKREKELAEKEASLAKQEQAKLAKSASQRIIDGADAMLPGNMLDSNTFQLVKSAIDEMGTGKSTKVLDEKLAHKLIKSQPTNDILRYDFGTNGGYTIQNLIQPLQNITIPSSIVALNALPTKIMMPGRNVTSTRYQLIGDFRTPLDRRRAMMDAINSNNRLKYREKTLKVASFYEKEIMQRDLQQGEIEAAMSIIQQAKEYNTASSMLRADAYGYNSIEPIFGNTKIPVETTYTSLKVTYEDISNAFAKIPSVISQDPGFAIVMPINIANTIFLQESSLETRKNGDVLQIVNGVLTIKLLGFNIRCILTDVESGIFGEQIATGQNPVDPSFTAGTEVVLMGNFTRGYTLAEAPVKNPLVFNHESDQVAKDILEMTMEFYIGGIVERPELFRIIKIKA